MYGEEMEQLISSIAHRCCRVTGLPNSPITKENQTERGVIALEAWTQNKEKRVASHTGGDGFADAYIYLSVFFFGGRQSVGPLFCRAPKCPNTSPSNLKHNLKQELAPYPLRRFS